MISRKRLILWCSTSLLVLISIQGCSSKVSEKKNQKAADKEEEIKKEHHKSIFPVAIAGSFVIIQQLYLRKTQ